MAGEGLLGGPPPEAVAYLDGKGFKKSFHWQDTWGEEHAHAFTVAKAMEMDVLQALREETDRAVKEGVPFEQYAKQLAPRLQALGWWGKKEMVDPATGEVINAQLGSPRRLQTIYWANTRTAYAAGQWERAQRTKGALPFFIYELGPSRVHRDAHVAIEGTVLPIDDVFWDTHYPPNGWGCKCRVRAITRFEAEQVGISPAPEIQWRNFRNKRTGEVTRVPTDIDPGWHTNPGKARARTLLHSMADRIELAEPATAKRIVADLWESRTPEAYAGLRERVQLPVAIAPQAIAKLHGVGPIVVVSSETLAVKAGKHRFVEPASFAHVQELLDSGELIERPDGSHAYWKQIDGNWWVAALRLSAKGFVRVATFFRSSERRRDEMRRARDGMRGE